MPEMAEAFRLMNHRRYPWLISIPMMFAPIGYGLHCVYFEGQSLSLYALPMVMCAVATGVFFLLGFYGMAMNKVLEDAPYRKDREVRVVLLGTVPLTVSLWPVTGFFLYSMWRLKVAGDVVPHYMPLFSDVILHPIICVLGLLPPAYALLYLWRYRFSDPSR